MEDIMMNCTEVKRIIQGSTVKAAVITVSWGTEIKGEKILLKFIKS
jgi:hypothetical protein